MIEAFRLDPELVVPESACRSEDPSKLPLRYGGEVIERARHLAVASVYPLGAATTEVGVTITLCGPTVRECSGGHSRVLELKKQDGHWSVVKDQEGGAT